MLLIVVYRRKLVEGFDELMASPIDNTAIYAINLESRPDKKKFIINEFNKAGINGTIVKAVDGNTLDLKALKKLGLIQINYGDRDLRRGEIGCGISHYGIWHNFVKSGKKYAIIFEDDAVIPENFKEIFNNLINETTTNKTDWDVFYLTINCHRHFGDKCNNGKSVSNNIQIPSALGYGLYGYVITQEAAKVLIKRAMPIKYPVDVLTMYMHEDGSLKFIQVKEPVVNVNSISDSDTVAIQ